MSMNQPEPSQASLDLVGHTMTHTSTRRPHPTECTVQTAEKVFSTISRADGTTWSSVRFKLKPLDGGRAFWTDSMPDEQLTGATE